MNRHLTTLGLALLSPALLLPAFAGETTTATKDRQVRVVAPKVMVVTDEGEAEPQGAIRRIFMGRGFLGVTLTQLTPELRQHFGASEDAGILVGSLVSDGPAEKAGVKVGDVIVAINGAEVKSSMDVMAEVRKLKDGDTANLDLVRDGRRTSLAVTIEERDRERIDLGDHFNWKVQGDGDFDMLFVPGEEGQAAWLRKVMPMERIEGISERLKAIDWAEVAERSGRSTEELEGRIADLEKKLADLAKKLEAATRDR